MKHDSPETAVEVNDPANMNTGEIIRRLWKFKLYFIVPIVLFALAGALFVSASIARNDDSTYTYKLQFNFSGVTDGNYPNGEKFHVADVLAPNVIEKIYNDHIAGQYNISGQQFRSAFTISSYSPTENIIIKKFQALFSNKRISFAEATRAQIELRDQLRQARRSSAIMSFQNTGLNLPKGVISTSMENVVAEWNRFSIENRGVLEINVKRIDPNFLDTETLKSSSEINRLHTLIQMHQKIATFVEEIGSFEVTQSLRDPETGATFTSLSSELSSIEGLIIDLSRNWVIFSDKERPLLAGLLSSNAFGNEAINGLDAQIAYDLLLERVTDIRRNMAKLAALGATAIKDPETGISVSDLQNILSEMETFQIRPLRDSVLQSGKSENPDSVRAYYQQRIRELELERKKSIALANVVDQVDGRYENIGTTTSSKNTTNASQPPRSTTVIPQFDDGFLDRLIQMSSKEDETKFRQELARKSIELLETVANIDSQIAGLKSDFAIFEAGLKNQIPSTATAKIAQADERFRTLLTQLRNHLEVTVRIGQRIAAADQVKQVFVARLRLEEEDSRLNRRSFLRSDDLNKLQMSDILTPMRAVVESANRMADEVSRELYGTKTLSESFSSPSPTRTSVINRRSIFTMLAALLAGMLVGAAWTALRFFLKD